MLSGSSALAQGTVETIKVLDVLVGQLGAARQLDRLHLEVAIVQVEALTRCGRSPLKRRLILDSRVL